MDMLKVKNLAAQWHDTGDRFERKLLERRILAVVLDGYAGASQWGDRVVEESRRMPR